MIRSATTERKRALASERSRGRLRGFSEAEADGQPRNRITLRDLSGSAGVDFVESAPTKADGVFTEPAIDKHATGETAHVDASSEHVGEALLRKVHHWSLNWCRGPNDDLKMLWIVRYPGVKGEKIFALRTKLYEEDGHGRCLWVEVLGMPDYNYSMPVSVAIEFIDPIGETIDTRLIAQRLVEWFIRRESDEQDRADQSAHSILRDLGKSLDQVIQASQHSID